MTSTLQWCVYENVNNKLQYLNIILYCITLIFWVLISSLMSDTWFCNGKNLIEEFYIHISVILRQKKELELVGIFFPKFKCL